MSDASPGHRRTSLAWRLLAGQVLIVGVALLTAGAVAAMVGPALFHAHLLEAGREVSGAELTHIERAYRDASMVSLGMALLVAGALTGAVAWAAGRGVRRTLDRVTVVARALSRGHYTERVPPLAGGAEIDELAAAVNAMAAQLQGTEETRRRLLRDLAHELRTPIATLSAYHDGLHDGVIDLGPVSRATLAEHTGRLARLADDIDEVSRAQEGQLALDPARHRLADLLEAGCEAWRAGFADRGITLAGPAISGPDVAVDVDRRRLGQVLTNVLANAHRHTHPRGRVAVAARVVGGEVLVTVADDGDGIPAEELPHAFERFHRGNVARDRDGSGSGIGLTISRAIVEAHGGSMTAISPGPGRGTTIEVRLPVSPPRPAPARPGADTVSG